MTGMRILQIGNFTAPHSTENELRKALEHLGHQVIQAQENWTSNGVDGEGHTYPQWGEVSHGAEHAGVDFVLWTHTHDFASGPDIEAACLGMIEDLRGYEIPSVSYHLDRWWGLTRQVQAETEPFFRTDLVITADGGHDEFWAEHGVNHLWMPPAVGHEEVGRGTPRVEYAADIAFVGGWANYGHAEWTWRKQMIHWLQMNYGDRLRLWPEPNQPAIRGAALRDLYASTKVVVGDSCLVPNADGTPVARYWSDRIPETVGRGGWLIHPWVEGIDEEFPLLPHTFELGNFDDLREWIELGLSISAEEHRGETEMGIEFVREHHTYVQRMAEVVDLVEEMKA